MFTRRNPGNSRRAITRIAPTAISKPPERWAFTAFREVLNVGSIALKLGAAIPKWTYPSQPPSLRGKRKVKALFYSGLLDTNSGFSVQQQAKDEAISYAKIRRMSSGNTKPGPSLHPPARNPSPPTPPTKSLRDPGLLDFPELSAYLYHHDYGFPVFVASPGICPKTVTRPQNRHIYQSHS